MCAINLDALPDPLKLLEDCALCPRNCHVDRLSGKTGYCRSGPDFYVSSVFAHRGEEPVISGDSGICNVFFAHCNLQCLYCQNYQISRNTLPAAQFRMEPEDLLAKVIRCLEQGCTAVGFVSPSHFIPQMKTVIYALHEAGHFPTIIFNTNGYDKPETIRSLEGLVDVYLPDLKYMDPGLAGRFSDARDYPEYAAASVREMFRQKGASLLLDENGKAESGLIIRHLVIPGHVGNSLKVLRFIAEELSVSMHLSLMSQYFPVETVRHHPELGRRLTMDEYDRVKQEMERLGFYRGWVQDLDSAANYLPDFQNGQPFGE